MESLNNPPQEYTADASLDTNQPAFEGISTENHQRLFRRGMRWLCGGVGLMGASFAINYLLFDSDTSFVTIMYVMTTVGAICIMKCLADILGF